MFGQQSNKSQLNLDLLKPLCWLQMSDPFSNANIIKAITACRCEIHFGLSSIIVTLTIETDGINRYMDIISSFPSIQFGEFRCYVMIDVISRNSIKINFPKHAWKFEHYFDNIDK